MASKEDISLVVEKVQKGFETGDQCNAMACGKTVSEWKDIFNAASGVLKMPVLEVGPLQGGTRGDIIKHVTNITQAFEATAGNPALILVDTTGNRLQKDPNINAQVGNYIESLSKAFPNAVYVQVIPEINMGQPLAMYCNNPKTPRAAGQPIYPL